MTNDEVREWPPRPGYWVRVGAAVIGIVVVLWLMLLLQGVILVLLASLVLALGLQPAIAWLEDRGWGRAASLGLIIVALNVVLIGGAILVVSVR